MTLNNRVRPFFGSWKMEVAGLTRKHTSCKTHGWRIGSTWPIPAESRWPYGMDNSIFTFDPVAVEPPVTRRPPHRSLRAGLPHKAPASGRNVQTMFRIGVHDPQFWHPYRLTYPFQRTLQPFPAQGPVTGLLARIAFGQPPFLRRLRRRASLPNFVRRFLRYYGVVRLLRIVHRMLVPLGFHARTHRTPLRRADTEISRLPRE